MIAKYKLIYNPNSGKKWWAASHRGVSLEEIQSLFRQYQIPVDEFPTKSSDHAYELGMQSRKEGYKAVIVAGGDGTVGQVANALVGTDIPLGILPLGSYMNIAKMLSIPRDLEMAIQLIKIGRTRKIDVGAVTMLNGKKSAKPYYFIESIGMGLEAELHQHIHLVEKGEYSSLVKMFATLFYYYGYPVQIALDDQTLRTRATVVTISNGPFSGASFEVAPDAKLNDHRLTISLFFMTKFELIRHFYHLLPLGKPPKRKIKVMQTKQVVMETKKPRLVHADGRIFGKTPISCEIIPNALSIITGFPKEESALLKRTYLDP